jgi:hypothetical protein
MSAANISTAPPRAEPSRQSDLIAAAQTFTGIAALVLGLTYAIGASLRAAELREAGVAAREGLAVIPIEQLLTRGIDALLSPRNVVLFAGLVLLAALAAASGWATQKRIEGYEKQMKADMAEARARMSAMSASEASAFDDIEDRARVRQLREVQLAEEERWREEELQRFREFTAHAPRRTQAAVALAAGVGLIIVVLGFVPWAYAVSVIVGVAVLAGLAIMMWRAGTPPSAAALFAGLLVVVASGIMVEGQVDPRPPALVALTLKEDATGVAKAFANPKDPHEVSGRLVAVTDQDWFLTSPGRLTDKMLSLSHDDVAAGVTTRVHRRDESIVQIVWDWLT